MEAFRTKLVAEHKRQWDEYYLRFPGERERSAAEVAERMKRRNPGSIPVEDLNASNDE
jgi:hypothetical protein